MNPGEFSRLNRDKALDLLRVVKSVIRFFLAVMERQYILKQEVRQERHIKAYFRYRDDIFLIARGGNGNLGTLAKPGKHVAISYKSPHLIEGWWCQVNLLFI